MCQQSLAVKGAVKEMRLGAGARLQNRNGADERTSEGTLG